MALYIHWFKFCLTFRSKDRVSWFPRIINGNSSVYFFTANNEDGNLSAYLPERFSNLVDFNCFLLYFLIYSINIMKSAKYIHQISTNFPVHKNKIEPLQKESDLILTPPCRFVLHVPLKYCDRSYTLWEPIYTNWTWEWTAICWSSWWPPPWCSSSCPVSPFTMMILVWHNLTLLDNNKTELKIYCELVS